MKKYYLPILFFASFVIQGCTTYWSHSGGRNWDRDDADCTRQATYQSCSTTNQTQTTDCRPNAFGGGVSCTTTTIPASTSCSDAVNSRRWESCIKSLGWRETDSKGANK